MAIAEVEPKSWILLLAVGQGLATPEFPSPHQVGAPAIALVEHTETGTGDRSNASIVGASVERAGMFLGMSVSLLSILSAGNNASHDTLSTYLRAEKRMHCPAPTCANQPANFHAVHDSFYTLGRLCAFDNHRTRDMPYGFSRRRRPNKTGEKYSL